MASTAIKVHRIPFFFPTAPSGPPHCTTYVVHVCGGGVQCPINNRPLKTSLSYAKLKLNRRVGRQRQSSWRLHQLVLRIQPSCCSLWYLLGHLGVLNRQEVRGLRSHCSSTLCKAHSRTASIWTLSRYLVTSNTTLIPAHDCLSMP
jgi:hypothetical protein